MDSIPLGGRLAIIIGVGLVCIGLFVLMKNLAPQEEPFEGTTDQAIAEMYGIDTPVVDKQPNVEPPAYTEICVNVAYAGEAPMPKAEPLQMFAVHAMWGRYKQLMDSIELGSGSTKDKASIDLGFCELDIAPQKSGKGGEYDLAFEREGARLAAFTVSGRGEFEAKGGSSGFSTELVSADPDRRIAVYQVRGGSKGKSARGEPVMGCALVGQGWVDSDHEARQLRGGSTPEYANFEVYVFSKEWLEDNKIHKALDNYKLGTISYGGSGCFS